MKKKLLLACLLSLNLAQVHAKKAPATEQAVKIGHVDMAHIIDVLPETKKLKAELESYQKQLNKQLEKKTLELQKKYEAFSKSREQMKGEERAKKEMELQQLHHSVEGLGAEMRHKLMDKQNALFQPIHERIEKAIQDVAKEHGYTHVFNTNPAGLLLLVYAVEKSNISELVIKKLGSKDKGKAKK